MTGPSELEKKVYEDIRRHRQLPIEEQVEGFVAMKFALRPFVPTEANGEAIKEFREILKEVLVQIWDVMKEEVKKIESIKLIFTSFACPIDSLHIHKPAKEGMCDLGLWQVIFPGSLVEPLSNGNPEWREYVKYQIAQQFCRFHLKKDELCGEDAETLANNLARLWGFVTIEPMDPEQIWPVWNLITELKGPEEKLDECLQRLIEAGMITKFRQKEKSRPEK